MTDTIDSAPLQTSSDAVGMPDSAVKKCGQWQFLAAELKYHRVMVALFLCMAVNIKSVVLWSLFVISWSVVEWLYQVISTAWRRRVDDLADNLTNACCQIFTRYNGTKYNGARLTFKDVRQAGLWAEIAEAVGYCRPFLLFALYLFCLPLALSWIVVHWLGQVLRPLKARQAKSLKQVDTPAASCAPALSADGDGGSDGAACNEELRFGQNKTQMPLTTGSDFFHSPAFSLTTIIVFAAGLPAFLTWGLYRLFQIDVLLGNPSRDPQFFSVIVVIGFYLMSLGWCLSTLFFRAWFTFPLNFLSTEHELILNDRGLQRTPYKGWFRAVLTMNNPCSEVSSLSWDAVVKVQARTADGANLYPLPTAAFGGEKAAQRSVIYRVCNRFARFNDSVAAKIDRSDWLSLAADATVGSWGRKLNINISELNVEEKARLFYGLRKWAPAVYLDNSVQKLLLGSTVGREARYTEIWFDLLTQKQKRGVFSALDPGARLHADTFEIVKTLASGGQATVYLAKEVEAQPQTPSSLSLSSKFCVLKEFILSDAQSMGALLLSARDFEAEASLLSRLEHPGVVKILDFFAEDRRAYLVLEYVRGQSLRQLVKNEGALSEELVLTISRGLCEIVAYLHALSPAVLHRDLSPDNIIWEEGGGVKLIDFSPVSVGKQAYTPPEQFRDEATEQSDIYSIGATMHFLLTGKDPRPLSKSSPRAVCPDSPISPALNAIVERATELEAGQRYEAVSWLLLELESLCAEPLLV